MNSVSENKITISPLGKSIIKTLAYYDIFDYPLNTEEIYYSLDTNHVSLTEILNEIEKLCNVCLVYKENNFYLLRDKKYFVNKRLAGNKLAEKRIKSAYRMSKFISKFPYVRAILLSGSI